MSALILRLRNKLIVKVGGKLELFGTQEVKSGGKLDVKSGGALEINGTQTVKSGGKIEIKSGATLDIKDGATVTGLPSAPDAGADTKGLVKQGVAVADAAGEAPTAAEFKALLDSLRAAGIIATAAAEGGGGT